jgi:hypothetical protein
MWGEHQSSKGCVALTAGRLLKYEGLVITASLNFPILHQLFVFLLLRLPVSRIVVTTTYQHIEIGLSRNRTRTQLSYDPFLWALAEHLTKPRTLDRELSSGK